MGFILVAMILNCLGFPSTFIAYNLRDKVPGKVPGKIPKHIHYMNMFGDWIFFNDVIIMWLIHSY